MDEEVSQRMVGRSDGMRWLWIGLSGMFILIGLAAVLDVLLYGARTFSPGGNTTSYFWNWAPWNLLWNLIGLFIFLWVLFFLFRVFVRPWRWHRNWDFWERDSAEEILRQRYARGEITKDQFDKMMDDIHRNRGMNL